MTHQADHNSKPGITIRRLTETDEPAVAELAERDSRRRPEGDLLGAEIEDRLLVAASVASGEIVADPFTRTDELRALIEMRIAQIKGPKPRGLGLRRGQRIRSRGALAESTRTGGKLLTLPARLS